MLMPTCTVALGKGRPRLHHGEALQHYAVCGFVGEVNGSIKAHRGLIDTWPVSRCVGGTRSYNSVCAFVCARDGAVQSSLSAVKDWDVQAVLVIASLRQGASTLAGAVQHNAAA